MTARRADLDEIRGYFARMMAAATGSDDPRYERVFELIPREAFVPAGPWKIGVPFGNGRYLETPSADPVYLYTNSVVALDPEKGINNGEPMLHAAWLGHASPQPGETVSHVGIGGGYYTALLATLTLPDGRVHAFEIDEALAGRARDNLAPFENVTVTNGDATQLTLPPSDLIYVNAGMVAPPLSWLAALRPQGRMIFPWRPSERAALVLLLTRTEAGFAIKPLMPGWFIACIGASDADTAEKTPDPGEAWSARSLVPRTQREPDASAIAIYDKLWFSSADLEQA